MNSLLHLAILCAALGSGLIAGVFFAFSSFVMRALARLEPAEGILAMQAINITVITPWFIGIFVGLGPLCIILGSWALLTWSDPRSVFVLAGSVVYLVGSLLLTIVFHIPMNDALADVKVHDEGAVEHWRRYATRWTAGNHVRTIASLLAAAAFMFACWA